MPTRTQSDLERGLTSLETRHPSEIVMLGVHWEGGPSRISDDYDIIERCSQIAEFHMAKNWRTGRNPIYGYGMMYSMFLARDGRWRITRPAHHVTWSANKANQVSYNILVDCNEHSPVTPAQRLAFPLGLDYARERFGVSRAQIFGHGELRMWGNWTECPGAEVLGLVRTYRTGQ